MRLFPIIAALVVGALVYAFVFERDRVLALLPQAARSSQDAVAEQAAPSPDQTGPDQTGPESPATRPVGVIAIHSQAQQVNDAVILRGRTQVDRQVDLRAETTGLVISDTTPRGSRVAKGDTLCQLDPGPRQATLEEARARLKQARSQVPQAKASLAEAQARVDEARINDTAARSLSTSGYASQTRVAATRAALKAAEAAVESARAGVERAQSDIQSAQAAIAAAEEEIKRLTIAAPFDGMLDADTAEPGSLMQPGTLCATLLQLDPILLVGFASETQVSRVRLGAAARATLISGDTVRGKVTFISAQADPTTRTFRVDVQVPNPDRALRDGETAEIHIAAKGSQAHLLPQSALTLADDGTLGVRLVDDTARARFHAVAFLRDTPRGVWVTGLPPRADVIVIGQEYVSDGVAVTADFEAPDQLPVAGTGTGAASIVLPGGGNGGGNGGMVQ